MSKPLRHSSGPGENPITPEVQELLNYLETQGSPSFQTELAGLMAFYKKEPVASAPSELIRPVSHSVRDQVLATTSSPETPEQRQIERQRFLSELIASGYQFSVKEWVGISKEILAEKEAAAAAQKADEPRLMQRIFRGLGIGQQSSIEKPDLSKTRGHEILIHLWRKKGGIKRAKYDKKRLLEIADKLGISIVQEGDKQGMAKALQFKDGFFHYVLTFDGYCMHVQPETDEIYIDPVPVEA